MESWNEMMLEIDYSCLLERKALKYVGFKVLIFLGKTNGENPYPSGGRNTIRHLPTKIAN